MVCQSVGGGYYTERRADAHYTATENTFSMDLATNRNWD